MVVEEITLDLSILLPLLDDIGPFRHLVSSLRAGGNIDAVVPEAAKPYVVAALRRALNAPTLVVTARPEVARRLEEAFRSWCGDEAPVFLFPDTGSLLRVYCSLPHRENIYQDSGRDRFL